MPVDNVMKWTTHSAKGVWRDGIPLEEIWRIYLEAITSEVVDKELPVNRTC
jgi:hypothetical protein